MQFLASLIITFIFTFLAFTAPTPASYTGNVSAFDAGDNSAEAFCGGQYVSSI